jgi:hypothetical protein
MRAYLYPLHKLLKTVCSATTYFLCVNRDLILLDIDSELRHHLDEPSVLSYQNSVNGRNAGWMSKEPMRENALVNSDCYRTISHPSLDQGAFFVKTMREPLGPSRAHEVDDKTSLVISLQVSESLPAIFIQIVESDVKFVNRP